MSAEMSGAIEVSGVEHVTAHVIDADAARLAEQVRSRMADHLSPEQNRLLAESFRLAMGTAAEESFEDLEVATNAVASTLELLARVPTASMVHDEMDEVLGMLARVLRNPGILT